MKKTFIIFSLALCTAVLGACNKDHDNVSNTENSSNSNGPAEDPEYSGKQQNHALDSTSENGQGSHGANSHQNADSYTENQTTTSARDGNTLQNNNRTRKDSVTSVEGQEGSGSGVSNGGSINEAQNTQKKK